MAKITIDPTSPFTFIFTGIFTIIISIATISVFSEGEIGVGIFFLIIVIMGIASTRGYYDAYDRSRKR